jgi:hypothetical protein
MNDDDRTSEPGRASAPVPCTLCGRPGAIVSLLFLVVPLAPEIGLRLCGKCWITLCTTIAARAADSRGAPAAWRTRIAPTARAADNGESGATGA